MSKKYMEGNVLGEVSFQTMDKYSNLATQGKKKHKKLK